MSLLCHINPSAVAGIEGVYLREDGEIVTTDSGLEVAYTKPQHALLIKGEAFTTLDVGLLYLVNFIWGEHLPRMGFEELSQCTLVRTDSDNPSFKDNVTVLDKNHKKILELSTDKPTTSKCLIRCYPMSYYSNGFDVINDAYALICSKLFSPLIKREDVATETVLHECGSSGKAELRRQKWLSRDEEVCLVDQIDKQLDDDNLTIS